MQDRVWVGSAAMPGPTHYRRRINRQDQVFYVRYGKWIVGAIADGCSAARLSEVGAGNLVHAAVQILMQSVFEGLPMDKVPDFFSAMMKKFLYSKIAAFPFGKQYLQRLGRSTEPAFWFLPKATKAPPANLHADAFMYLAIEELYQATLLAGLVHEDEGGIILVRGDGRVSVDGAVTVFDYNNMPPYFAYDFALDQYPGPAEDLQVKTVRVPAGFSRAAFTSDGWNWDLTQTHPFGLWNLSAFESWLLDQNNSRAQAKPTKPNLTPEEAWQLYRPEEVNNLARRLVKNPITPSGVVLVTDDLSGIFVEREVFNDNGASR